MKNYRFPFPVSVQLGQSGERVGIVPVYVKLITVALATVAQPNSANVSRKRRRMGVGGHAESPDRLGQDLRSAHQLGHRVAAARHLLG